MQRRGIGDRERHESAVTAVYRAGLDDRGFERSEKPVPIPEGTRGALDASGCGSMRTGFFGYEKSKSARTTPAPLFDGEAAEAAGPLSAVGDPRVSACVGSRRGGGVWQRRRR